MGRRSCAPHFAFGADVQHCDGDFRGAAGTARVGVLAISRDGVIQFVNGAALRMFGYAEAALLGQSVDVLLPPELQSGHGELRATFFACPAARGMCAGRRLLGRRADGSPVAIEIGLGLTGSGDMMQAIAFVNDVPYRWHSEERFEAILAALPVGFAMIDATGRIELTNRVLETMFGYDRADLVGQYIDILLPTNSAAEQETTRALNVLTMGAGQDVRGRHRSGKEFPVEIAISTILLGYRASSLAIITDISVRTKLEHALQQANANLEEFTYIASHDLRSPLRGIADLLEWIQEDLPPEQIPETIGRNFDRAKQRVVRAERMIEDLLTYARASRQSAYREIVNPRALLQEALEGVNVPARFEVTIEAEDRTFLVPKIPLQTALRNLLDNALKHHGGTSGLRRCSFSEAGQFYVFTVDDNGQGVPAAAREKIFKLFQRASNATEGHGIGLSVTRRMVTSHGGRLVLEERSALGGSAFAIYWPQIETGDDE
jgi:PAS domain S-box-containing protein